MQDLQSLLKLLIQSDVDFVLIGGFAAVLHGSNQTTRDIDICLLRSPEQLASLRDVLAPYHPRHRMKEGNPPFLGEPRELDETDLYLTTDLGILDIVDRVEGVGKYYDVLQNSEEIEIYGGICRIIGLEDLIKSKQKLGRHRDLVTVMELETIRAERKKS